MQAVTLDRNARLRAEIRTVISDLRRYGVPEFLLKNKTLIELWELRDAAARNLMGAPTRAA
jgi:hypothetical protein